MARIIVPDVSSAVAALNRVGPRTPSLDESLAKEAPSKADAIASGVSTVAKLASNPLVIQGFDALRANMAEADAIGDVRNVHEAAKDARAQAAKNLAADQMKTSPVVHLTPAVSGVSGPLQAQVARLKANGLNAQQTAAAARILERARKDGREITPAVIDTVGASVRGGSLPHNPRPSSNPVAPVSPAPAAPSSSSTGSSTVDSKRKRLAILKELRDSSHDPAMRTRLNRDISRLESADPREHLHSLLDRLNSTNDPAEMERLNRAIHAIAGTAFMPDPVDTTQPTYQDYQTARIEQQVPQQPVELPPGPAAAQTPTAPPTVGQASTVPSAPFTADSQNPSKVLAGHSAAGANIPQAFTPSSDMANNITEGQLRVSGEKANEAASRGTEEVAADAVKYRTAADLMAAAKFAKTDDEKKRILAQAKYVHLPATNIFEAFGVAPQTGARVSFVKELAKAFPGKTDFKAALNLAKIGDIRSKINERDKLVEPKRKNLSAKTKSSNASAKLAKWKSTPEQLNLLKQKADAAQRNADASFRRAGAYVNYVKNTGDYLESRSKAIFSPIKTFDEGAAAAGKEIGKIKARMSKSAGLAKTWTKRPVKPKLKKKGRGLYAEDLSKGDVEANKAKTKKYAADIKAWNAANAARASYAADKKALAAEEDRRNQYELQARKMRALEIKAEAAGKGGGSGSASGKGSTSGINYGE